MELAMPSRRKTYAGRIKHPDDATEPAALDPLSAIAPLFRVRPEIQDVCRFALQWEVVHEAEPKGFAQFHIVTTGSCLECVAPSSWAGIRKPSQQRTHTCSSRQSGRCRPSVGPVLGPPSIRLRPGPAQSFLGPVLLGSRGNLGQRRRPKHTHRSVVASFQKRNRNPTVGAMLLRWRKPEANPPFTC